MMRYVTWMGVDETMTRREECDAGWSGGKGSCDARAMKKRIVRGQRVVVIVLMGRVGCDGSDRRGAQPPAPGDKKLPETSI